MGSTDCICVHDEKTLQFCVDYCKLKLNAVTKRESYPILCMDEYIDTLGDATVSSTLDDNSSYWKIEIENAGKEKTTLTPHNGLYRFICMKFGLRNAPGTLQRIMDVIRSSVIWKFALVHSDDIVFFSKTPEHISKTFAKSMCSFTALEPRWS